MRIDDPVVKPLLEGLAAEYEDRYGSNDELSRTDAREFDRPQGLFLVLLDGDVVAAGGGYRYHGEGVCEVKRMWTNPLYRRRGLAARVLDALEMEAAAAGYMRMVLETGLLQPEAAALYDGRGYKRIPKFGPYPEALAFEAELSPAGASREPPNL